MISTWCAVLSIASAWQHMVQGFKEVGRPCQWVSACLQEDGQAGIQELGGNATLLFYQTAEGEEGRRAFLEKRPPDFSQFPRFP